MSKKGAEYPGHSKVRDRRGIVTVSGTPLSTSSDGLASELQTSLLVKDAIVVTERVDAGGSTHMENSGSERERPTRSKPGPKSSKKKDDNREEERRGFSGHRVHSNSQI